MNKFTLLFATAVLLILQSCSSSNDVASNHIIQKRKYRSGFHLSKSLTTKRDAVVASAASNHEHTDVAIEPDSKVIEVVEKKQPVKKAIQNVLDNDKLKQSPVASNIVKIIPNKLGPLFTKPESKPEKSIDLAPDKSREITSGIEADDSKEKTISTLALIFGIATWVVALLGVFIPFISALAIPFAIVGFLLGKKYKDVNQMADVGYMFSMIFLIIMLGLMALALVIAIIFLIIFLLLLSV